jgi:hypothetical protein
MADIGEQTSDPFAAFEVVAGTTRDPYPDFARAPLYGQVQCSHCSLRVSHRLSGSHVLAWTPDSVSRVAPDEVSAQAIGWN